MKEDLIRFRDCFFLDMRKSDVNKLGWHYFGPAVKYNHVKPRTVMESLCCAEYHDTYY